MSKLESVGPKRPQIITRNGMRVRCYGTWFENSNAVVVSMLADGSELEQFWAEGATNWTEAVETLTAWAERNGHTIKELQAC